MKYSLTLLALIFAANVALAHPGGLDAKGGHTDAATGKYHIHKAPDAKKDQAKKPAAKKTEAKKKK